MRKSRVRVPSHAVGRAKDMGAPSSMVSDIVYPASRSQKLKHVGRVSDRRPQCAGLLCTVLRDAALSGTGDCCFL